MAAGQRKIKRGLERTQLHEVVDKMKKEKPPSFPAPRQGKRKVAKSGTRRYRKDWSNEEHYGCSKSKEEVKKVRRTEDEEKRKKKKEETERKRVGNVSITVEKPGNENLSLSLSLRSD